MHILSKCLQRLGTRIWLLYLCLLVGMILTNNAGAQYPSDTTASRADAVWNVLLIVIEHTDVGSMHDSLSKDEIDDAVTSFYRFPCLVADLTDGRVQVIGHALQTTASVTRVSDDGKGGILANCQDVYEILRSFDGTGEWDTLMVFWKRGGLPSKYWGWGGSFTPCGSTYACVTETSHESWEQDDGEVFLHEWLHGVSSYFERLGYAGRIPAGNADAADQWGYHPTPEGWNCDFYADLMNGAIPHSGGFIGFSRDMWRRGAPRHPTDQQALHPPPAMAWPPMVAGPPRILCGLPPAQRFMFGIIGSQPPFRRR